MFPSKNSFQALVYIVALIPIVNGHIYGEHDQIELTEKEQQGVVATLTILLFILMALDFTGPEVLFLIALMIVMLCQILTLTETLSGFANESMITIGTLFLVIAAVEKSHIVDWLARKAFGTTGSQWFGQMRMYITCFCLSIFFNNTPLVAILLPVVKDWGRVRGIAASQLLIPLSYAVLAGSFGSMIGTSTNLTIQGLMQADRDYAFPFFAPMPIGIVCFVALLLYMVVAGPFLLPTDKNGLIREARDQLKDHIAEIYVSHHSSAVGYELAAMMNSLGIAPSLCIKIRRRGDKSLDEAKQEQSNDNSTQTEAPIKKSPSTNFLDINYLKESAKFWYEKPNIPDRLGEYNAAQQDDTTDLETAISNNESYYDIITPSFHEVIRAGDVIFVASAQDAVEKMMKSIMGESRGLYILKGNVLALPGFGTELVECVISDSNPFLGMKVSDMAPKFAERYKAGLITVRRKTYGFSSLDSAKDNSGAEGEAQQTKTNKGDSVVNEGDIELAPVSSASPDSSQTPDSASNSNKSLESGHVHKDLVISEHVIQYGDTILCVTNEKEVPLLRNNHDFFVVSEVGSLPKPLDLYLLIPVAVFVVMLCLVASEYIEMCPAALTVTAFFFIGGWIKPQEIPKVVDIRLLMLMGCSLSFAKAMTKSGLALEIAKGINNSNPSSFGALMLIYAITLVITELISNNAAAALMYPIAVALADELGVSFKAFAMAVLVASTAGFMSPIGYQTHVMVWGPGGYSFRDFVIFGIVPDIIYWVIGCALITVLYPL